MVLDYDDNILKIRRQNFLEENVIHDKLKLEGGKVPLKLIFHKILCQKIRMTFFQGTWTSFQVWTLIYRQGTSQTLSVLVFCFIWVALHISKCEKIRIFNLQHVHSRPYSCMYNIYSSYSMSNISRGCSQFLDMSASASRTCCIERTQHCMYDIPSLMA